MDYGPTIAAAFGSYDPKEVDALREAIVECMRNTPLDGGIKATGAVAERPGNESQGRPPRPGTGPSSQVGNGMNQRFNSSSGGEYLLQIQSPKSARFFLLTENLPFDFFSLCLHPTKYGKL